MIRFRVRAGLLPALALAGLTCGSVADIDRSDGIAVLFIGNSLTYENDLPGALQRFFEASGLDNTRVESVVIAGAGLQDHWALGRAQEMIAEGGWDVVIVQQGPSATEGRPSLLEYSRRYADEAERVGARLGVYMVWPAEARFFDFDGVSESHQMAADLVDGLLFPVGEAWRAVWRHDPDIELYGPDRFHPTATATYLAALVMFDQLVGKPLEDLPLAIDPPSPFAGDFAIPPPVAEVLRTAAREANAEFARR